MTAGPSTVEEYVAGFPPDVAERLRLVHRAILEQVPQGGSTVRYGMAAVMLGGRYALHFGAWKHHIGLYPVPTLPEPLESEVAPLRSGKDGVALPHAAPLPIDLVERVAAAVVRMRTEETGAGG